MYTILISSISLQVVALLIGACYSSHSWKVPFQPGRSEYLVTPFFERKVTEAISSRCLGYATSVGLLRYYNLRMALTALPVSRVPEKIDIFTTMSRRFWGPLSVIQRSSWALSLWREWTDRGSDLSSKNSYEM
jgi:hypothetical protein